MTKHDDYMTWQQGAEIARQLMDLKKAQRKSTRAAADLRHAALDGARIPVKDEDGTVTGYLGSGPTGVEHVDGPPPAQPAVPHVDAGQRVVKVQLSGLDADEGPAPSDFWRAEIHVSLDEGFEPSLSTLATYIDEPNGSATHSLPAGEWWVGVVWVTLSKQRSVMSELVVADIEPPVDAAEIEADLEDARQRIKDAREYADEQFDAFDVRVESAETDINDAHDRIDAAEGALSSTQSDLDAAKADITAAKSVADQAVADALAAANLAEGKGQVITQKSAPTGSRAREENLWVRLPDMKVHYYDGDKWEPVLDPDTIAAAQQAANALTKANDLQTKHDALKLAVDGEGGLKDRLSTAENTLEDKAASSDLQELDDILRGTEDLPPQIADRFYAAMAIVEKLQTVSGWVGGVNLADGAVTAEKIHATREMITKIMGAEWAYIAEQLVVDGDLIANNADIISAVIKNLDVTEQSNFVDAFAEQLGTKEFTALVATMARAIIAAPNLWPDPDFEQDVYGSWSLVDGGIERDGAEALSVSYVGHSDFFIPIEPGTQYILSVDLSLSGPGRGEVWLRDADANKAYIGGSARGRWTTEAGRFETTYEALSDQAKYLYIGFGTRSTPTSTRIRFENLRIERMLDGRLTVPGSIDVGSLNVTEEMVASFARILHLVVDQIDVNSLWADQTWQNAGHFGSEDADQMTNVDGTGLLITRSVEGEHVPAAQFGGGGDLIQMSFWDEDGEQTGSVNGDGDAAFRELATNALTVAGRGVFPPTPAQHYEGYLWDALPKGIIDKAPANGPLNMAGVSELSSAYGFLEVSAHVVAGREYRVSHTPFLMATGDAYHGQWTYTFSDTGTPPAAPHTESDRLGPRWRIIDASGGPQTSGEHIFTADQTGIMRILLNVRRDSGYGIHFHSSSFYTDVNLILEDLGPARRYTGIIRNAYHGGNRPANRDNRPLVQGLTTRWQGSWVMTYRGLSGNAAQLPRTASSLIQGRNPNGGLYFATMIGGFTTTPGEGDDTGKTIQAALQGEAPLSARIIFRGVSQPFRQFGNTNLYWHAHNQPPQTLHMVNQPPNNVLNGVIGTHAGSTRSILAPPDLLTAIANDTFQGFTIHPTRHDGVRPTDPYHGIRGLADPGFTLELVYQH